MSDCIKVEQTSGCWQKADGSTQTVLIVREFGTSSTGAAVLARTHYTQANGDHITLGAGESVSIGECCGSCTPQELEGCADGVSYKQIITINGSIVTNKWLNLEDGAVTNTKPTNFVLGSCADVPADKNLCYANGVDIYTHKIAQGISTYYKNGVELTSPTDIAIAQAVIANATAEDIVDCVPPVETCKGGHYQQLTLVAGTAQTITHDFGLTDPLAMGYSVRGVNGGTVGDWPTGVRFINQTATTVQIVADGIGGVVDVALTNMECLASGMAMGGGGGGTGVDTTAAVVSTDSTIDVTSSVSGNVTTYDISYNNSGPQAAGGQSFSANTVTMADQSVASSGVFATTVVKLGNTTVNSFINGTTYNAATGTLTIGESANYLVTFSVRFGSNISVTAGKVYLSGLIINGVLTYTNTQQVEVTNASRSDVQVQSVTIPITLNAGTTVQLAAAQNDTAASKVYASRGTYLTIARLSAA